MILFIVPPLRGALRGLIFFCQDGKKNYFCNSIHINKPVIMKKLIILLTSMLILGGIPLRAQTPMALPYGSFEQWTTHQGYSVSVLFLQVPIYDAFSTPTGWNYPSYPINQTVSLMGMNININTSVPLILANAETASVPAGTKAVRLQTLKVEDIVDPTALTMASGSIDSTLLETVIPSVLSTGELDLMAFLPIIDTFLAGMADPATLLPTLLQIDANDYVSAGQIGTTRITGLETEVDGLHFQPATLTFGVKYRLGFKRTLGEPTK